MPLTPPRRDDVIEVELLMLAVIEPLAKTLPDFCSDQVPVVLETNVRVEEGTAELAPPMRLLLKQAPAEQPVKLTRLGGV